MIYHFLWLLRDTFTHKVGFYAYQDVMFRSVAALLTGFHRLRRREGQVFAMMLVLYPITRFILESIRDDNPHDLLAGSFTHNQYTSIGMFVIGVVMLFVLRKLPAAGGETWSQRAAAESQVTVKPRNKSNRNRRY